MKQSTTDNASLPERRRASAATGVRGTVLGLAFFAAGSCTASAWWFARSPASGPSAAQSGETPALSAATMAVLQRLGSPVEIRFYSLLDPASVGEDRREFAGGWINCCSQYEQAAGGKIKVARVNTISDRRGQRRDGRRHQGDSIWTKATPVTSASR